MYFLITNNYGETEIVWFKEQRAGQDPGFLSTLNMLHARLRNLGFILGRGRDFAFIHCAKIGRLPHPVAQMDSRGYFAV